MLLCKPPLSLVRRTLRSHPYAKPKNPPFSNMAASALLKWVQEWVKEKQSCWCKKNLCVWPGHYSFFNIGTVPRKPSWSLVRRTLRSHPYTKPKKPAVVKIGKVPRHFARWRSARELWMYVGGSVRPWGMGDPLCPTYILGSGRINPHAVERGSWWSVQAPWSPLYPSHVVKMLK